MERATNALQNKGLANSRQTTPRSTDYQEDLTDEIPNNSSNTPLDPEFLSVVSRGQKEPGPAGIDSTTKPENQAQLVANPNVITAVLLLLGVGFLGPDWAIAQDSGGDDVEIPSIEAAPPADLDGEQHYLFFPRTAAVEDSAESFSSQEQLSASGSAEFNSSQPDDLGSSAWDASERFSNRRFLDTVPVQYPLDNSAYEGEDPTGQDPDAQETEGNWRESSVARPDEGLPALEDQPWIQCHKITFQAQTLPTGDKGLGITSLDLKGTFKPSRYPFVFVSPRVGLHFLDSSPTIDLPDQLYDFSLDTTVFLPLNDRWMVQVAASPSLFTDGKAFKNSIRMVGRGLFFYRWSPELQLAGGFVYLGRKDIVVLPAAGFVYTPNDDVKYDIMFPKPRAAYRYQHDEVRERWVYVSGELGGGSWAVERASGAEDVATYRDFQLLLGIEHKQPNALNWQLEGGYVFSREVQYLSKLGDTTLPATAVLRMVLSF